MKVAVVATHPIQYQVPLFRALAKREGVDLRVFYGLLPDSEQQGVGFGTSFAWDIPLLDGYAWEVLENRARRPSLQGFLGSSTPAVFDALSRFQPQVVLLTGWQALPLLQALWASLRLRVPVAVRGESNALRQRPWPIRAAHRLLLSRFDAYLAIGRSSREFYLRYGISPDRIFPSPYFVDNRRFYGQAEAMRGQRSILRAGWGIPDRATCFVYSGKLVPKKRIIDLLAALRQALVSKPDLHLLVAGTGELMDSAQEYVRQHDLPVTFAGFLNQTEISRTYVASDCLVLPSDHGETWGLVVNEAMISGLPVIVSDRVGCRSDLVVEGKTGWSFPFGDVKALAARLVDAASDAERRIRMGEQARQHVQAYSVDAAVQGVLDAFAFAAPSAAELAGRFPVSHGTSDR